MTELRDLLHEAVAEEPRAAIDPDTVVRRSHAALRRRRVRAAGVLGAALLVVAVALPLAVRAGAPRPAVPTPTDTPRVSQVPLRVDRTVDLADARPVPSTPLASARTLWLDPANDLDYDRLDGVTDDGLVVRQRYHYAGDRSEFALLDVATGRTDWLPRPPMDLGEPRPLLLGRDRLVYLDNRTAFTDAVLTFDRHSRTWSRRPISKPAGTERFFGFRTVVDPERDVVYLVSTDQRGRSWWSVDLRTGGVPVEVPALRDTIPAWQGRAHAVMHDDGLLVVTRDGLSRVLTAGAPNGCRLVPGQGLGGVVFVGQRLVAEFPCAQGARVIVFDEAGRAVLQVSSSEVFGLGRGAARTRWVLLSTATGTFAIDTTGGTVLDLGGPMHGDEPPQAVVGDLAVWNHPGPRDAADVLDVVYEAGRLR